MRPALRVTFVAGDLSDGGGVNRVISELSGIFAQRLDAEVSIIGVGTRGKPTYPVINDVNVEVASKGRPIDWRTALSRLRRDKPDVVIGPWTQANILLIVGLLFSGSKIIVVEHASWDFHGPWVRMVRDLIYRYAWRVVVLNPTDLVHYRRHLPNVCLLPNPVSPKQQMALPDRRKLIIGIGHLLPNKNFVDAVKAMALSGLEESGWELAIIGTGPEEGVLREAIREAGLIRTQIHPQTDDPSAWYNRASLAMVTSKREVFSLVLAEAMSAGVLPVAYASDGPSFLLENFPDHLVPIGDVVGLSKRLRAFAQGDEPPSLRSQMAASIAERFSPDVVASKWQALMREAH